MLTVSFSQDYSHFKGSVISFGQRLPYWMEQSYINKLPEKTSKQIVLLHVQDPREQ